MKKKWFIFFPREFIGVDNLMPVVVVLAAQGYRVISVFPSLTDDEQKTISPSYLTILRSNSIVVDLGLNSKGDGIARKLRRLVSSLKLLKIVLEIILTAAPRVITVRPAAGLVYKLLKNIASVKGFFYCMSRTPAPIHADWYEAYFVKALNDPVMRKDFLGKKPGNYPVGTKRQYIGRYLIHSPYENRAADIVGYPDDRIPVGYPKLLPTWLDYLKTFRPIWDNSRLNDADSFLTILLLSKDIYLFDPKDSVDVFLDEIVSVIRKYFRDELIVIKTKHQLTGSFNNWVYEYVHSLGDDNIIISTTPTPFIAEKTAACFMVGDTTACFDFIIREIPCVEHTRYSEGLLRMYPRGSCWADFGVRRTSTMTQLEAALHDIRSGRFEVMRRKDLNRLLSQPEGEEIFTGL